MIPYRMLLLFSEYCRENYEPVGSDRDVDDSVSMLLLFSEYCRENYEPVGSDRDVDDSVSDVIVVFRVLSREL